MSPAIAYSKAAFLPHIDCHSKNKDQEWVKLQVRDRIMEKQPQLRSEKV